MMFENLIRQRDTIDSVIKAYTHFTSARNHLFSLINDLEEPFKSNALAEISASEDCLLSRNNHEVGILVGSHGINYRVSHTDSINRFHCHQADFSLNQNPAESHSPLPSPSTAIKQLLSQYPSGLQLSDIVSLTRGKFETSSDNPEHIIRTTIGNLRRTGELRRADEDGRILLQSESDFFSKRSSSN